MEVAETLRTIAELAIAIAGFTGVVVVFGSRTRGEWTRLEADRLWLLLAQALMAALLAFVPILLHSAGLADQAVWRISNGTFAIAFTAIGSKVLFGQGLAHRNDHSPRVQWWSYTTFTASTFIAIAQFAYSCGIVHARGPFLFLVALLWVVAMAATNFWQLLMGSVLVHRG